MKIHLLIIVLGFISNIVHCQNVEFNVKVSKDTVLLGDYVEVQFEIKNGEGQFTAPDFRGMSIIGGPNHISSYSNKDGIINQHSSYTYFLEFDTAGNYVISSANLKISEKEYNTTEVKIVVLDNPNAPKKAPGSTYEKWETIKTPTEVKKKSKITKI